MTTCTSTLATHLPTTSAGPWVVGALTAVMVTTAMPAWGVPTTKTAPRHGQKGELPRTNAGGGEVFSAPVREAQFDTRRAILEVRRLSGLTWDQLAQCFGVDRRSLHFWASGKPLTPQHRSRLEAVLQIVRQLDQGAAAQNRDLLTRPGEDGRSMAELIARGEEASVLARWERTGGRQRTRPPMISPDAAAARKPIPPSELVGALSDPIPVPTMPARRAPVRRVPENT